MPRITLFTTNTCAYCQMVKNFLKLKGFLYQEVNLDLYPDRRQEAIDLSGSMTVPVILVERDNGKRVVVGYNLQQLIPAIS